MEGIIIKGIGGFYYVKTEEEVIECKARGKFRYDEVTPMVGDRVNIAIEKNKGVIEEILNRSSKLIRPQVANVSQAFVVFAIKNPNINFELLNKFLLQCEYSNIKPIICISKVDLAEEEEKNEIKRIFDKYPYELLFINSKEGSSTDELKKHLTNNITVLCGPSGAGKSTLLNKLIGKKHMETGNVSEKIGRGKHTTRHSELVEVEKGYVVDTPGFSTLEMNFISKEELKDYFPEFQEYENDCKYRGCLHYKEPGCKVQLAVEDEEISREHYEFYINYLEEISQRRNNKW